MPRTFTSLLGRFAGGSLPGRWLTLAGLLLSFAAQAQLNVLSRQPTRNAVAGGGTAALSFTPTTAFAPGEVLSVSVPPTLASTSGAGAAWQVYQFTAATGGTGRGFFLDMAVVGNTGTRDQLLGDLDLLTGGYIQFNGPAPAANPLTSTPRAAPAASVSFYPNPAQQQFTVVVPAGLRSALTVPQLRLFNALGQQVLSQPLHLDAKGEARVAAPQLPAGLYTAQLRLGEQLISQKLVLQKLVLR